MVGKKKMDNTTLNFVPYNMTIDFHMFNSLMDNRVCCYVYGRLTIAIDHGNWFGERHVQINH